MLSVPSVATSEGTRKSVMIAPLAIPSTRPRPIPAAHAAGPGNAFWRRMSATTKATRPIVDSTDRSMFLVMMTRDSPTAAIAMIAARVVTWLRFEIDRKWGAWIATTAQRRTITPPSVSSRERPSMPTKRDAMPGPAGRMETSADIGRLARRGRPGHGRERREARPLVARRSDLAGCREHHALLGGVSSGDLRRHAALVQDEDPVAHREHLGQVAGDQDDPQAGRGEVCLLYTSDA